MSIGPDATRPSHGWPTLQPRRQPDKRRRRRERCWVSTVAGSLAALAVIVVVSFSLSIVSAWNSSIQSPLRLGKANSLLLSGHYRRSRCLSPTLPLAAVHGDDPNNHKNNSSNNKNNSPAPIPPATSALEDPSRDNNPNKDDDERKRWLQWMTGGRPRGTSKVILREAAELGGVPRNARYSSRDWFHSAITLPNSGILKLIRSPLLAVTSYATFVSLLHRRLLQIHPPAAARLYLPTAPHSLMMSVLGLLLVFRTNSAYARFNEGRKVWEDIINGARDLYRMMMLYEGLIGWDKRRRLQKLLAAFPYLLRHRIRPNLVMRRLDDTSDQQPVRDPEHTLLLYQDEGPRDLDPEAAALATLEEERGQSRRQTRPLFWVDKRTLPWRLLPPGALEKCARVQNRPLWVCDRMAAELRAVPDQGTDFTNRERLALITHVDKLSRCIGEAERIHQTSVPLYYARHTLRALTIWLFSLPHVLVKDLELLTGPVLFFLSWMLWGIFEIGVKVEDPFQGTLRLSILCDTIRRDVLGDDYIRSSAFRLEESPSSLSTRDKTVVGAANATRSASDGSGGLDSRFE